MSTISSSNEEFFIVVDVEAAGPNPSNYSMLSIGACSITSPQQTFYVEMQPDKPDFDPEALGYSQLSIEHLQAEGIAPKQAMEDFGKWVAECVPHGCEPVFTALNAPFDWMFVNDYFHRYLGYNPFGYKALDIKPLFMGLYKTTWGETSYEKIIKITPDQYPLSHHALDDAVQTARIFQTMLAEIRGEK